MSTNCLGPEWNLTEDGLNLITNNGSLKDKSKILQNALNTDLKDIGCQTLDSEITKEKFVLQIQKIRNIAAPKANENSQAAPRMLKLILTDGVTSIQALEVDQISSIHIDKTPPGSKLLVTKAKIVSGYLLLSAKNCVLLGGKVPHLIEKWEISKSIHNNKRQTSGSDGPPAWVNFGSKIQSLQPDDNFKSIGENKTKDNTEFELLRKDAITEATSGAVKKVFGGGVKQPTIQSNVTNYPKKNFDNSKSRNNKFANKIIKEQEEKPDKPAEKVSLFSFLEDKLPVVEPLKFQEPVNTFGNNRNRHYENNYNGKPNKSQYNNRTANINQHQPTKVSSDTVTNEFNRLSINNNQFASRSLRQHLNLGPKKNESTDSGNDWKVGQECLAKYWEDEKFYNAIITAVTDKTYAVKFKGYGNIEEVLKTDCLPLGQNPNFRNKKYEQNKQYSGTLEFRRGGNSYRNNASNYK